MLVDFEFRVEQKPGPLGVNQTRRAGVIQNGPKAGTPYSFSTPEHKAARKEVAMQALLDKPFHEPLDGPVAVWIDATWPMTHRKGSAAGFAKGDVDAIAKAVLDAMKDAGVYHDDTQVVDLRMTKRRGDGEGFVRVRVQQLDPADTGIEWDDEPEGQVALL